MTISQSRYWRMLVLSIELNRPSYIVMVRYHHFMKSLGEL